MRAGHVPPHSIEAEQAVLGAAMLSIDAMTAAATVGLEPWHFYKPQHRDIFAAMSKLYINGAAIDAVTVIDQLRDDGHGDVIGVDELHELQNMTPAISAAGHYAKTVVADARRRGLIKASAEISELGYDHTIDADDLLARAELQLLRVDAHNNVQSLTDGETSINGLLDWLETHQDGTLAGLSSGLVDLDDRIGGLQAGKLYIIGARPSMGKTALALRIADHVANHGVPVLYATLEMSELEITQRRLALNTRIDLHHLVTGNLTESDWAELGRAVPTFHTTPWYTDDSSMTGIAQLRAAATRIRNQADKIGLIVVDYLQLMSGSGAENRQLEVSELSRGLKILARELEVPVIALSQLSRNLESRSDKRPMLSDLRESGALEQDADVVMFLYRDDVYHPDTPDRGSAEVIIAKQRSGPTGTIRLAFLSHRARFDNIAH